MCLSKSTSSNVEKSSKTLKKIENFAEEEDEMASMQQDDLLAEDFVVDDLSKKTIRQASPFTNVFENAKNDVEGQITTDGSTDNPLYMLDLPELLIASYLPLFPLWSGVMLAKMNTLDEIITRDTNSPVENWFKYL